MNGNADHKDLGGGIAALPLQVLRDDRLDAALAFLLAFSVLGGVAWYAASPLISNTSLWTAAKPAATEAMAPRVVLAPEEAASAVLLPRTAGADGSTDLLPLPVVDAVAVTDAAVVAPAVTAVAPAVVESVAAVVVPASAPVVAAVLPLPVVVASVPAIVALEVPTPAPPVAPVAEPKVVIRENFQFALNSAQLPQSATTRLDAVAKVLASDPRNLTISGHTDNSGKPGVNTILSLKRAEAVRAYLVAQGASADRLKAVGMGPKKPIADNKTEAGRAQNRRIDITE